MSNFNLNKNGTIYLIHHYGQSNPVRISTHIKIDSNKWDKAKQKAKSSNYTYDGLKINIELIRHASAFNKALQFYEQNSGFSLQNIKQKYLEFLSPGKYLNTNQKVLGFIEFFEQRKNKYKKEGINNWSGYGSTLNHLKKYFKTKQPTFEEIDSRFYELFNDYLRGCNLSKNTISNHWKHIKAIMRMAELYKYHSNNDYQNFKRKREETDAICLNKNEINAIYKLNLKGTIDVVRDYFIIGCTTGLRFSDWDKINSSIIKNNVAYIRSSKTGELSIIPIHKKVKAILKKYKGTLPKKLSLQKMNVHIKSIGLRAKITEDIITRRSKGFKVEETINKKYMLMSTHTARRSFATILVLEGESPYVIMKITGHKTISAFEKYVKFNELQAVNKVKDIDFFK